MRCSIVAHSRKFSATCFHEDTNAGRSEQRALRFRFASTDGSGRSRRRALGERPYRTGGSMPGIIPGHVVGHGAGGGGPTAGRYSLDFRLSTMSMRESLGIISSMETTENTMVTMKAHTKLGG